LSDSFLTYDTKSVQERIYDWKTKLPWIKPHYAVKSNPIGQLLEDVKKQVIFFIIGLWI